MAKKFKITKSKILITTGVVVVLLATLGVGIFLWWQSRSVTQVAPKQVAQSLGAKGDYSKAQEVVGTALKDSRISQQDKYDLFMQQGYLYEAQKNPDAAMGAYRQAETVQVTMDVTFSIARLAADKGDKELAISYYQKALTLIPSDDAMRDEYKKYFESAISVLQTGQPNYE
ncbi:MAG TPA: tetratricopeptide repeat protein [Magnetospirillaceae bacterium]|nr:tetratricopeptide repeat protein [Magnetospirillaceae bacterium]